MLGVGEVKPEGDVDAQLQDTVLKVHSAHGVWPVCELKLSRKLGFNLQDFTLVFFSLF